MFKGDTGGGSNLPYTLPTTASNYFMTWMKTSQIKKEHLICIFVSGATPRQCDRGSLRLMDAYMRTQIHLSHSVISSYKGTTWEGALRKLCIPIDKNIMHLMFYTILLQKVYQKEIKTNLSSEHVATVQEACDLFVFITWNENIAKIANAVQVTICLLVSTSVFLCLLVSTSVY